MTELATQQSNSVRNFSACLCPVWSLNLNALHWNIHYRYAGTSLEYLYGVSEKSGPFIMSSYLCFHSYELHENFQKYIGGVACCEYEINACDSLAILC